MSAAARSNNWLPDFCRLPSVFGMMIAGELVVLVIQFAASTRHEAPWRALVLNTCFVQWIVVVAATVICQLRSRLHRLPLALGMMSCWSIVMATTAVATIGSVFVRNRLGFDTGTGAPVALLLAANLSICALVTLAALRYWYIQQQWRRNVESHAEAQFKALQARIRPHFLFNSMNTIASLIRTRPAEAENAVEDLSDLFRAALAPSKSGGDLDAELELVSRYLKMEKLRLGDRLSVRWDTATDQAAAAIPPLLIQPLVENAVYHGIQQLPEGGEILIRVRANEKAVEITIGNPTPEVRPESGHRIALDNVRQRLDHLYDGRAKLEVDQEPGYYRVTLRVPRETSATPVDLMATADRAHESTHR